MIENDDEPCGSRNFEEKENKIAELTKDAMKIAYPIYWYGLNLLKDVISLLIKDVVMPLDSDKKKYSMAFLMIINRSIQHIESVRVLIENGLYGDSFVLTRSIMSDVSMMQYLHFHPELLDLFLNEKQDDYQTNKDFKKAFSESAIEKELVEKGLPPFSSSFQLLSKASHTSSFGAQLYGSRGKKEGEYHMNYGPKFQADKGILLMDLIIGSYYDLITNVLWHRHHAREDLDTPEWNKVKEDLRKLKKDTETFGYAVSMTVAHLWPKETGTK